MRFDRLRLCGFKSFVEPVDIEIKPGLTGIVGPNGCGKSNLVEGLRWLMGANSAKAMRASGMDEVIFAGTAGGRAARSWAEVSLEIDNSERRAPAQFNDTDQLVVARRVVRRADGSVSQYTINGKEVRARDVQMLFADASTGATSPSLVRQGQISELINAKPTERRRFLEEAAGVTGLAARRHEAQLRLKAAGDNLERLDDVIGELDVQSEQLQRQARKAAKFKTLTEDIKDAERELTAAKIGAAHKRYTRLDSELGARRTDVADAVGAAAAADREASALSNVVDEARAKERDKATSMTEASAAYKSYESERALREQAAAERERSLEKLKGDASREQSLLEEASTATASATQRITELRAEIEGEGDARARLEEAAQSADENAQDAEDTFEQAQARTAELRAEARAAAEARRNAESRLASAEREKVQLTEKLSKLPAIDAMRAAEVEASAREATRTLTEAETRLNAAEETLEEAHFRAAETQQAAREAQELSALLKKEEAVLLPLIPKTSSEDGGTTLLTSLAAPENVRAALAAALGDALNAALGDGDHAWTSRGASTGDVSSLPAGAVPLSSLIEAPAELTLCLSGIGVMSEDPSAAQLTELRPGQMLINRTGDLWRWDGYQRRGEARGHLEELLSAAARLSDIQSEIELAENAQTKTLSIAEAARADSIRAGEERSAARNAHRDAITAERQTREASEAVLREQTTAQLQRDALSDRLASANEALTKASEALAEFDAQKVEQPLDEQALNALRGERDEARRRSGQARGQAAEHRRLASQRRENLRQQEAQARAWNERRLATERRIEELTRQRTELEAQIAADTPAEGDEGQGATLEAAADEAKRIWERARDELAEAEQSASLAERKRREAEASASSVREALAEITAELRAAKNNLEETLAEAGVSEDAAEALLAEGDNTLRVDEAQAKLSRLERERERLGAVNLLAADEQVQVEERLSTLRRERTDCEDASSQLQSAVNAINREGRQRLLAAFEAVNGHFRELFTSLFGGGEAHLKFVDNDDPLAAGLEIFACPPGKKLQSLSLMSGGEQALTATALIFAAFKTNPAPVCVLDEVDAPLDDANVERFCNLLSLMAKSATTRFIVVTHHPLTMSRVDRLFGVTMMERGVSRLFGLDLDSARRLAA